MMNKQLGSSQYGQALPLTLVLMSIVAAVVFYMFNTGQLVQEKMRLTNTADAVAYSAGVYEARVLNYDAYTNRAMIANEIAIGHSIGLASWAKYAATTADNISPWVGLIPYVGPYLEALLQEIKEYIEAGLDIFSFVAVLPFDTAIQSLKLSQMVVHSFNANNESRNRVMVEVARKNDPDVTVDLSPLSDDFASFTQYYQEDGRTRMLNTVERNRQQDDFLKSRNWDLAFGLCIEDIGGLKVEIRKVGGTGLIGFDGWKSIDTLSAHLRTGDSCSHEEEPIGYGSSASAEGLADDYEAYRQSSKANPDATEKADESEGQAWDTAPPSITGGEIPAHWGLSETALSQDDPRTHLAIRVTKEARDQRYSGGVGAVKSAGTLALYDGKHVSGVSASIARVEVYFERPDGANPLYGKAEKGSLFNPYWQVHLVPVTVKDREVARKRQGFK